MKELRLREISDVEAANAFVPAFMADSNRRFACAPRSEHDAHRLLHSSDDLARIFSWQETRLVSKSLTLHYKRVLYVLDPTDAARAARGKPVRIEKREDGSLCFWNGEQAAEVVESKRLAETMEFIKQRQRERTEAKLAKPFTTLRKARLLHAGTQRRTATGPSSEARP